MSQIGYHQWYLPRCYYPWINRIDNDFTVYRFTASPLSVKFGKPEFEGKIRTPKEAFKISPNVQFERPNMPKYQTDCVCSCFGRI